MEGGSLPDGVLSELLANELPLVDVDHENEDDDGPVDPDEET